MSLNALLIGKVKGHQTTRMSTCCRLLNEGNLEKVPRRPALLITDAAGARAKTQKNEDRNRNFAAAVLSVLRGETRDAAGGGSRRQPQTAVSRPGSAAGLRGKTELTDVAEGGKEKAGSVLLPVDTAGRMLEVLLVLDKVWQSQSKARYVSRRSQSDTANGQRGDDCSGSKQADCVTIS